MAAALACCGFGAPASAQGLPQRLTTPGGVMRPAPQPPVSQPVVQQMPGRDGRVLDAALGRLARDPRDIDALIDAGNAALVMGDVDAATGFFRRADQVSPGNPRVKAGLAGAMVHSGDPFDAIPLFQEAEKAGALDTALAADRGLAYDLVGDNATAQRYYRQALARSPSDEVVRRLALSLAISGDKHNAELILSPLLQQRDLAAWRTRAFALAVLGQTEEAVSIANTILPADLAAGVAPYLRYMPRLTHAQQAAAANFGTFPRASEIGRDDPRVAQYAPAPTRRSSVASADAALVPQGEPLGRKSRSHDRGRSSRQQEEVRSRPATTVLPSAAGASQVKTVRLAPPEPQPARQAAGSQPAAAPPSTPSSVPRTALTTPAPAPMAPRAQPIPAPPVTAPPPPVVSAPPPAPPAMMPVSPAFTLAPAASAAPASPPPAPTPAPVPIAAPPPAPVQPAPVAQAPAPALPPPVPRSLASAFAEFERPNTDATPAAGAVDIRRIGSSRPKAEKPAAPPPPTHPSRIWVQVATGRDKAALGFDWRRMTREAAEAFRGKQPFVTVWGQTNRLLTGPFQSEAAANSFIAQLRRADVDGAFVWTSPAGQVVDALPAAAPRR